MSVQNQQPSSVRHHLSLLEKLNFLLTNRIPRRYATLFMGWFSKIENPLISRLSIFIWCLFSRELNLAEAKQTQFKSLHDCFIRELKPGKRDIADLENVLLSPCDAIVGAHGHINGTQVFQTKGFPYTLEDLLPDQELVERYRDGVYVTLRLKATMYHRFHAPCDCHVDTVNYISGDTWNVNPVALKVIEKLYCKNERAVIDLKLDKPDHHITLVPVAAILVAGIKLHGCPDVLDLRYKGPNLIDCNRSFKKAEEMGYFQHGSTIIIFANNRFKLAPPVQTGLRIWMGQPLFQFR